MTHGWVAAAAGLVLAASTALASPAADSTWTAVDSTRAGADSAAIVDSTRAEADSARAAVASAPPPDSASAWIVVTTKPSGLRVRIGDAEAGTSPIESFRVAAGRVTVRGFPEDPRLFEPAHDGVVVDAAPGETLRVDLDLRPYATLQSVPISSVSRVSWNETRDDSLLGTTPIRLPPALLEWNSIRFAASGYADSVTLGRTLLAQTAGGLVTATVALRSLGLPPPAPPKPPSLFKRKWFAWTLVGVGALVTGGAVVLRDEADRSYERYLDASDPRVIEAEYDRTLQYDRYAAGALVGGQILFTTGILLLVTGTAK
ncbi:MAG TPA: hypothetical protein VFS09_05090 [Candidatus Eisenbacteria bacterium]|nr:hypothetical protein [Candidatus Eisenbacteria bacterium]